MLISPDSFAVSRRIVALYAADGGEVIGDLTPLALLAYPAVRAACDALDPLNPLHGSMLLSRC